MNVLSLFDGMSACRLALERAGFTVDKYYTSEIDKYASKVSHNQYPDQIALGDVTQWQEWDIDWASIDLVTGGFPCQSWSLAGKQLGDRDPRGQLFWVMLDIIKKVLEHNPKAYFLMENVRMKKEFEQYITMHTEEALGHVEKHLINSALVSAQNRNRYYWTNITGITQPEDKGIVLADILQHQSDVDESMYYGQKSIEYMERGNEKWMQAGSRRADRYTQTAESEKAFTLTANFHKGVPYNYFAEQRGVAFNRKDGLGKELDKSYSLNASDWRGLNRNQTQTQTAVVLKPAAIRGRYLVDGKRQDGKMLTAGLTQQMLEVKSDQKTNTLTTVQKDNVITPMKPGRYPVKTNIAYRKLTPIECERLQTFPDGWTEGISNTQRYKSLGNAWTVDVVAHIFSFIGEINIHN